MTDEKNKTTENTSIITINDNLTNFHEEGKKIYNNSKFMRSITNIMENPEFKALFDEYFNSIEDMKIFLLFTKVYNSITKQFPEMNGYEKIAIVKRFISNSKTRKLICDEINSISTNNKLVKTKSLFIK